MKFIHALLAVVAILTILGLIGTLAPIGDLAEHADRVLEASPGLDLVAERAVDQLVDRLNESGYDRPPIDPDEPLLKRRTILISEGMHERVARHVIERMIYLDAEDPTAPIDLRITTSGGWTDSAFAIVDTMRSLRAPVNVTALGACYSAGTVILAAGTGTRSATPSALLSIHVNDFRTEESDGLDYDTHELARFRNVYQRYTSVPPDWFDEPGDNQYYLDAQQALRMELIDEIAEPVWQEPETEAEARPAA